MCYYLQFRAGLKSLQTIHSVSELFEWFGLNHWLSRSVLLTYLIDSFMFLISEFKKLKVKMSGGYDYPDNILKKNYKIK